VRNNNKTVFEHGKLRLDDIEYHRTEWSSIVDVIGAMEQGGRENNHMVIIIAKLESEQVGRRDLVL